MIKAQDFFKHVYSESDEAAAISGTGAKRQTKSSNSKTRVDVSPEMKDARTMTDDKGTKGFDRNTRPNDHRPNSIQFPGQNYSPTNPVARNQHLTKMWNDSIAAQTARAQRLQRPGNK